MKDLTDIEIVELYKESSDLECVGVLFKRYSRMTFVLCDRILKDETRAKEAMMGVFENLITYLKKYKIDNFRSWLISVIRNHCFMILRKRKQNIEINDFYEKNPEIFMEFDDVFNPKDKEKQEERFLMLDKAISSLPREQAECVELFYCKGNTYEQISEITGFSFNQIKSHIQNGKRNIKNILSRSEGLAEAVFLVACLLFN